MNKVAMLVYNMTLIAGTAFLVTGYDWSPWWFLLTLALIEY